MTNSRASKGTQLLKTFTATSTGTTNTWSLSNINKDTTAKLILVVDILSTASLALHMQLNGFTTSIYHDDGRTIIAGTEVLVDNTSTAFNVIIPASMLPTGARAAHCETIISMPIVSPATLAAITTATGSSTPSSGQFAHMCIDTSQTEINEIILKVSTSSWAIGTRFLLYQVKT